MKKHFLLAGFAALMLFACNNKPVSELTLSGLDPAKFQTEVNNTQTNLYTLKNKAGMDNEMSFLCNEFFCTSSIVTTTSMSPATSVLPSDVMPIVSIKDVLFLTVIPSSYHKTISGTVCTEVPRDGNIKYMRQILLIR